MTKVYRGKITRRGTRLILAIACAISVPSCRPSQSSPVATSLATVESPVELPVVVESPEQLRAELGKYPPNSAAHEETRFKLIVALDVVRKREGVEGFQQSPEIQGGNQIAVVDPASGKIAWRALACFNPHCPGRGRGGGPFLFAREQGNSRVTTDGKLILGAVTAEELSLRSICPACERNEFVQPYDPAETEVRRRQLLAQLAEVRQARDRAEAEGRAPVLEVTPAQISQELLHLPKLFLVPETDQVAKFEAVLAPKSRGLGNKK